MIRPVSVVALLSLSAPAWGQDLCQKCTKPLPSDIRGPTPTLTTTDDGALRIDGEQLGFEVILGPAGVSVDSTLAGFRPDANNVAVETTLGGIAIDASPDGISIDGTLSGISIDTTVGGISVDSTLTGFRPGANGVSVDGTITGIVADISIDGTLGGFAGEVHAAGWTLDVQPLGPSTTLVDVWGPTDQGQALYASQTLGLIIPVALDKGLTLDQGTLELADWQGSLRADAGGYTLEGGSAEAVRFDGAKALDADQQATRAGIEFLDMQVEVIEFRGAPELGWATDKGERAANASNVKGGTRAELILVATAFDTATIEGARRVEVEGSHGGDLSFATGDVQVNNVTGSSLDTVQVQSDARVQVMAIDDAEVGGIHNDGHIQVLRAKDSLVTVSGSGTVGQAVGGVILPSGRR